MISAPLRFGLVLLPAASICLCGCFALSGSDGGGEARFQPPRVVDASDVALHPGYEIEPVAGGLTFPTDVAFDENGRLHVLEAGYSYGEVITTPRLLRREDDGTLTEVAAGSNPPWNGVAYHDGAFYVAGGTLEGGQILRISPGGEVTTLVDGLPSMGDHHTNGPVVSPDGWVYFGQGTATNSAVVGLDNYDFGWLERYPEFHDVPCEDVTLTGMNFRTDNPLSSNRRDDAVTGAYVPFGTPTEPGQVIPGEIPCTGAVLRVRTTGGEPELVAWGLRNPFGLAFAPDGRLFVTDNQYDVRGSRPVFGTGDLLWQIEPGAWYGWPDFAGGRPLTRSDWFAPPGGPAPGWLLEQHPSPPPQPAAVLGVHSSSNGIAFSTSPAFGFAGQAFIAQFGDMAPGVGKVLDPVGFKVVRVDAETGEVFEFATNRGGKNGPASLVDSGGLERPVSVAFDPEGQALYIVDFGVMTIRGDAIIPHPRTGVVWRITQSGETAGLGRSK